MPVTNYLFFGGNCAEAMQSYERILGGKLQLMTYADAPEGSAPPGVDSSKVMHAYLTFGEGTIMASDDLSGSYRGMSGFGVALFYPDAAEVKRVYEELAKEGQILMPLQKLFWTEAFGGVIDRFGTPWMVAVGSDEM